ncbi:MAG TPA: tRNA adenosine deaminase-associated protein [Jatrophihabitantaceae bacterium]|jgi:putative tRNA adenosine deaminase-associated protein
MSYFGAVLARSDDSWRAVEVDLDDCESLDDLLDVARDVTGDVRLLVVEQDDEYAVLARVDSDDEARVFLSDGHAADEYPIAALVADELDEIGEDVLDGDEDAPPAHDSAPFGDASVVDDLGTSAGELLELCAHEGTLPIDLIVAVCEKAGCADAFEALRV